MEKTELHGKHWKVKDVRLGFFENQVWGALHKAWKGYTIAKTMERMIKWRYMHVGFKSYNMT
jgi:hypothetical protein